MKKTIIVIGICIIVFLGLSVGYKTTAAVNTLNIYIGDSNVSRHHCALVKDGKTEELHFTIKNEKIKSSKYESKNPNSFSIINTGEGKCIVRGLNEGTGLVILTVNTVSGKVYTEKLFISVYTRIGNYEGVTNKTANVYMGASENSGVENYDNKGSLTNGIKINITASCGEFYIFKTQGGVTFKDGKDTGFIKKNDVNIMAQSVSIGVESDSLKIGSSTKLDATIFPQIATKKEVIWETNNPKCSTIDSKGNLFALAEGFVIITASVQDGSDKQSQIGVSLFKEMEPVTGILKENIKIYKHATKDSACFSFNQKKEVVIIGQCLEYYRCKYMDDELKNQYGYILKRDVHIPVQLIEFNKKEIKIEPNKEIKLFVNIEPSIASEKRVNYYSDNKLVADVDDKGVIHTYKEGVAHVKVFSIEGSKDDICTVTVYKSGNDINWISENEKKVVKRASKGKLKARGYNDKSILVTWKGFKDVKWLKLQRAKNNSSKFKTIKKLNKYKKRYIDKKVKFFKRYKYRMYIKKENNEKEISNVVSARTKDSIVKIKLKTRGKTTSSIELTWNNQKHVSSYCLYRKKGKNGKEKELKELKKNKNKYIDRKVRYYEDYYYRIKVNKTNGKSKSSSWVRGITLYKYNLTANNKYMKQQYPFICMDSQKNINDYYVFDNYFSPIKYQFNGKCLYIHLYIDFARYTECTGGYNKEQANRSDGISGKAFVDLFKKGLIENYEIDIAEQKYEFKGINFSTKIVIHERGKEKYDVNQQFNEVLIGGECPNCSTKDDHWYHENGVYEWDDASGKVITKYARVYMPYTIQLKNNAKISHRSGFDENTYPYVASHEIGHTLGLYDAYYVNCDRFTDNGETGVKCEWHEGYDNLMKEVEFDKKIVPNDLEMMLYAYNVSKGKPWDKLQAYKTADGNTISACISNKKDMYDDGKND